MKIILAKGQFMGPISGADETLVAYATQLRQAGHSVTVLMMYPHAPRDQYYVRLRKAGVPVLSIAPSHVHTSLNTGRSLARRLMQVFPPSHQVVRRRGQKIATSLASRYFEQCCDYLRQSQAGLIHVITPDPSAMVMIRAAHVAGIPVLYQELGMPYHPAAFKSYYEEFTKVLPLCAEVAALSPQLAEECREKLPFANSLSVLPITTDVPANEACKTRSERNGHGVTFGFAARLEVLKGPLTLIEAFATCHETVNASLTLAGTGTQHRKILARAEKLGVAARCHFPRVYTRPDEKSDFMRSLDVFVLPSLTEGTPNSIVEAMAHGLPVIATRVGGIPDVVTSETGLLVPPGDAGALARAMIHLAGDSELRARMGRAAKERYEQLFSPLAVLPLILGTYGRIARANGDHAATRPANGNGLAHPWARRDLRFRL
jgi:glycosyltransferase involved in cell wall biosynthesis